MRDTSSHGSEHVCLICKESIQNCTVDVTERTHHAGRTDGVKPIYPPQFHWWYKIFLRNKNCLWTLRENAFSSNFQDRSDMEQGTCWGRLFYVWLDYFTFFKLGVGSALLGVLLVAHVFVKMYQKFLVDAHIQLKYIAKVRGTCLKHQMLMKA